MGTTFKFSLLITAIVVSVSTAVAMNAPRTPATGHACFAVTEGVCFSGPTKWVAQAAEKLARQQSEMKLMVADAN